MSDFCATNAEYALCTQEVNRDLVTATAAIAALSTFCMGLFANLPIALAPGMGLNAYFAYTVVGVRGSGLVSYSTALTAVFVEGWVFLGLTLIGMRQWLARALPSSIKLATGVGIGLYLALIGLTYDAGIGLVQGASSTPIELAGCASQYFDPDTGLCIPSEKMRNPTMWIGIFCGGILTALLMMYRIKGAVIIGILLVSIISWPRTTPVTYFPYTELGTSKFDFFKKVVTFHPIKHILAAQDWDISGQGGQFGLAFITFLVSGTCFYPKNSKLTYYSTSIFWILLVPCTQWPDLPAPLMKRPKISKAAPSLTWSTLSLSPLDPSLAPLRSQHSSSPAPVSLKVERQV
jgi:AGZA family xanthine/uracil permease-like MFS transporter